MSNFKVKQQVRSEVETKLIRGKLYHKIDRLCKAKGIGADFTDGTIPNPAALADGLMAYNVTKENIEVTDTGAWTATALK